jgi:NTE family protein
MKSFFHKALTLVYLLFAGSCATYPANPKLAHYEPGYGYRFSNLQTPDNSDSLFVILTFSGGGTRAAALSYGVLEKLRDTKIQWEGRERRLLDEIDVISSVSGGSFTAAYFGLFREELFDPDRFAKEFLYRDIESELVGSIFNPVNWFRLASPTFGRIELAEELYDREIFRGKTFADLMQLGRRPFILLNATDVTMGSQFTFVQDQFDLLCSDLSGVPVARAVAASSNFPVAFTPLIINNYAGSCAFKAPGWIGTASEDLLANPPRYNRARIARSYYVEPGRRPYIHLLDGGVADNIGLLGPLVALESNDPAWNLPNKINLQEVKKIVVIVVDARTAPKTEIDSKPSGPGLTTILDTIATVPMSNYSFDTVRRVFDIFNQWEKDRRSFTDCQKILKDSCPAARMPSEPPEPVDTYAIYVGFDQIKEPTERQYFLDLPTTFSLPEEQVDRLRKIGPAILDQAQDYRNLCAELKCR